MLQVQKFLRNNHTFEDLAQFGIVTKKHPVHDIWILDYDQIDSKINHYISDECRSLVLDANFDIVSGCMSRFYNIGQCQQYENDFTWHNFTAWEKRDGSIISITLYKGELLVRTRFSWADSICGLSDKTWKELVFEAIETEKQQQALLSFPNMTFVFELETPYNQVVLYHEKPQLVLLTMIDNNDNTEWYQCTTDQVAEVYGFKRPQRYEFKSLAEIQETLNLWEKEKKKDEGFVLLDAGGKRLKIKNKYYMMYHSMCTGIQSIRQIFDIVWNPNIDKEEVSLYFPHLAPKLKEIQDKIDQAWSDLWNIWFMTDEITERKRFAFAVTRTDSEYYTPFSSILFRLRDIEGNQPADKYLREEWLKSKDLIFKVLFKEK